MKLSFRQERTLTIIMLLPLTQAIHADWLFGMKTDSIALHPAKSLSDAA